jgi:hypothetical protein
MLSQEYGFLSESTIQVHSNISVDGDNVLETVQYSGGKFIQPLVITNSRHPYEDFWLGFINGVEYPSVVEAYAAATGQ